MNNKTSKINLTENEQLWLREIYQLFLKNQFKPDIKKLKRKLMSKLNPYFNPKDINPLLLKHGNEITPFAIKYIDPETKCFQEIDFIIKTIKKLLSDNELKELRIKELSQKTNLPILKFSQLLHLISTFDGYSFWSSSGHEKDGGFIYIGLDREEVIDEYIAYTNINDYLTKEQRTRKILKSALQKTTNENKIPDAFNDSTVFVDIERIKELKDIDSGRFDLSKLIRLCEELNFASEKGSYFSVIFLLRSILDHIPPIFDKNNFAEVANQSKKSHKHVLQKLDDCTKKIAHIHLHSHISEKEMLPNRNQTNYVAELDLLLCEIIKQLNKK